MDQSRGTIKYVNPAKDFGFITPATAGQPDVFFSFGQMRGNAARLPNKGESVIYEAEIGKRGPVACIVYNLADPLAVEDLQMDQDAAQRMALAKQTAQAAQKAFTADLIERNRQWRAARGITAVRS